MVSIFNICTGPARASSGWQYSWMSPPLSRHALQLADEHSHAGTVDIGQAPRPSRRSATCPDRLMQSGPFCPNSRIAVVDQHPSGQGQHRHVIDVAFRVQSVPNLSWVNHQPPAAGRAELEPQMDYDRERHRGEFPAVRKPGRRG